MKDGGKKRKASRKQRGKSGSRVKTISIDEDDGTQVETKAPIKKRATRREKKTAAIDDPEAQKQLRLFCLKAIEVGVEGLSKEFLAIKAETSVAPSKFAFDANKPKNRYQDVFCADQTRVILRWPPGNCNDYIHANWVELRGDQKFICTQGPTEATIDDFWRLVWQEKCKAIVMLCEIMEQNKRKCEPYWPATEQDNPICTNSGLTIKNISVIHAEEMLTVSRLQITSTDPKSDPFEVRHIKWNNWPDRGVPKQKMAPFRLLARIHGMDPVLIHCSAGIGRTGTIVGLQMAMQVLEAKESLSMPAVVKELRARRHGSVQTDSQYIFVHRVLVQFAENRGVVSSKEVEKFSADYEAFMN